MGIAQYIDYHIEKTMLWIQGTKKIRRLEGLLIYGAINFMVWIPQDVLK
jgi:hypothetical protein